MSFPPQISILSTLCRPRTSFSGGDHRLYFLACHSLELCDEVLANEVSAEMPRDSFLKLPLNRDLALTPCLTLIVSSSTLFPETLKVMAGALAARLDHEAKSKTGRWQCNDLDGAWVPQILCCTVATPALDCLCRNAHLLMTLLFGALCNLITTDPESPLSLPLLEVEQAKAGRLVWSQGGLRAWCLLGTRVKGCLPDSYLWLSLKVSLY